MKLKTVMSMVGVAALAWQIDAAPSVEITGVQQQYPWTNTVDISYNVTGVTNEEYFAVFEARHEGRLLGAVTNELDGTGQAASAVQSLTTQWFPDFDLKKTGVTMTPYIYRGGVGAGNDYLIIDLETWKVTYEGMVTQEDSNRKYNTDEYKTKKMVFRKVPAGTYYIGGPEGSGTNISDGPNSYHSVNMGKDYYMGIFLVTTAQYNRMLNGTDTSNSKVVIKNKTWNEIRGSAGVAAKPTSGPIANLNSKTGYTFDMPTESMWEVAARAGVTAKWITGEDNVTSDKMLQYAVSNASDVQEPGTKKPNNWGFYDITGNGWQWCRDMWNIADLATLQTNGLVPITTGDSSYRAERSRGWSSNYDQKDGRLSARRKISVNSTSSMVIRLALICN